MINLCWQMRQSSFRPSNGSAFHMTASEHHGMGHKTVAEDQPGGLVHPSLDLGGSIETIVEGLVR